jgi:hypothetical protein
LENNNFKETALRYINAKLPVIPVIGKIPAINTWKEFQDRIPTSEEVSDWFDDESVTGIAMICGHGVTVIDFDDMGFYNQWRKDIGDLAGGLPEQKSGKGRHIAFRCDKSFPKCKLAMVLDPTEKSGQRTGIEILGTGGYVLVAPSEHINKTGEYDCRYENISGEFNNLPLISEDRANQLIDAAKALNQVKAAPRKSKPARTVKSKTPNKTETEFNNRISIAEVLNRNDYEPCPYDTNKFRSPTSESPPDVYGVLISDDNTCFSFHASDPLCGNEIGTNGEETRRRYNAFNAFRILEHAEDYHAAYTAAEKELGLGTLKYVPKPAFNLPTLINYDIMATHFPPLKFIVPKYLPEGLFILAGKQKLGKSWLALDMCLAVATGGTVLNEKVEQGRAIYFALEDGARRLQDRLLKLGLKDKQPELLTLAEMGSLPPLDNGGYELLENLLKQYTDTRLLIIDTLGMIKPPTSNKNGYEEDVKIMAPLREMAKEHGIALVLVTHVRKTEANDTFDEVHGSVGLTGTADGTIKLSRKRGKNKAIMDITGRDIEEVQKSIELDKETFKWQVLGDVAEVEMTVEQKKVADLLDRSIDGLTPSRIGELIDKKKQAVGNILKRMKRDDLVISENGKYKMNPNRFGIKGISVV